MKNDLKKRIVTDFLKTPLLAVKNDNVKIVYWLLFFQLKLELF